MIVRLQDLRQGAREYDIRVPPAELHLASEGVSFGEPVCGHLRFQMFGERVRVTGWLETTVEIPCVRCLKPSRHTIRSRVGLVFEKRPATEPEPTKRLEVDWNAESRGIEYYDEEMIDVTDSFRQLVLLELPGYPVCRPTCRGLCPRCGADLNEGDCGCEATTGAAVGEDDWKTRLRNLHLD